jgi:hypothetical protein
MFEGDWEGMRDSFRNMLGILTGILEKLASAAVVKMVLDWLNVDPEAAVLPWYVKVGLIPVVQATASGLVHGIVGPILNDLMSFSTGGRVDEPTLAVIGDASRSRPGADTEWVTRDADIRYIATMAAMEVYSPLGQKLDVLIAEVRVLQNERTLARGSDIMIAYDRAAAARSRRART